MRNAGRDWKSIFSRRFADNLKFLILREGRTGLHQVEISGRTAVFSTIAIIISVPILMYMGSHLLLETTHQHRTEKLRRDNQKLTDLVMQFQGRIEGLEREIISLNNLDVELRQKANLPPIPAAIRQIGIGGSHVEINTDMDYLLPTTDVSLAAMAENLDALFRGAKLEKLSYESIRDALRTDFAQLRNTPSLKPINNTRPNSVSGYEYRQHPYTGKWEFHSGMDFGTRRGTEVFAAADGRVIAAAFDQNLGFYIKLDHGRGFHTVYGHLRSIDTEKVQIGVIFKRGTVIAVSGSSGRSTAPHLHYEVRQNGQALNPANFF